MRPEIGGELFVLGTLVVITVVFLYCGAWAFGVLRGILGGPK